MATGFGIDATIGNNGVPLSGQTAEDTRRVWGSLYTDGIISGCTVTPSSSGMTYTVAPGAVVIPFSAGQNVPAPCYGGSFTVPPAPATGSRTDIIWARQNIPTVEGNSDVVVGYSSTLPARAVMLDKFTVNAGNTNTAAALRITDRRYAVPLNGGRGILHQWIDTYSGVHNQNMLRLGHKTITLPSDRIIRMSVSALLYANGAVRFDDAKYCEWFFLFTVDNGDRIKYTTPGLHQAWATYTYDFYTNVTAGTHTFSYARGRQVGPGSAATHYGVDNMGHGRLGTVFTVEDIGPVA